jgi:hypothetical protein
VIIHWHNATFTCLGFEMWNTLNYENSIFTINVAPSQVRDLCSLEPVLMAENTVCLKVSKVESWGS